MASVIATLREEHKNIARLLNALDHQLALLAAAQQPDYELLRGIADYFCDYPDRCHHPKEDAVLARLRAQHPEAAAAIGDLAKEHREAGFRVRRFRDAIQALFRDEILSRDSVVNAARSFVEAERRHMQGEESVFFPLAEKELTAEDWRAIGAAIGHERDPLSGGGEEAKFVALRERLLTWESEYRPR
jgi:hemerythrin-like domain-containing protein